VTADVVNDCAVDGCDRPSRSRGWCVRHYARWTRCGNPAGVHRYKLPWPERLWSQVTKTDTCWLWNGEVDDDGYGHITGPDGRRGGVHRLSLAESGVAVEPFVVVMHRCDVPNCLRPDHLRVGTNAENVADMIEKGRFRAPCGEANGHAIVTDAQVVEIRQRCASGETQRSVARAFGIAQPTVSGVVNYKSRVAAAVADGATQ
jgi:ribosomal protein S14